MTKKDPNPNKEMTILDHITELRNRVLVSFIFFAIGTIDACIF